MKNIFKKITLALAAAAAAATLACFAACSGTSTVEPSNPTPSTPVNPTTTDTAITFDGDTATTGLTSGVSISGTTVTITAAGEYEFKGTATDGNIVVSVAKTEKVTLVLSGVNITSKSTAPIYVASADKVHIVLSTGTTNVLTDPSTYDLSNGKKPNACIYSKDDIEIEGSGSLTVNANYNNGIGCKNDIKITGGNITVSAVNNAIKGQESVQISGGAVVTITKCDDGIKTEYDAQNPKEGKYFITLEDCTVSITATDDGIVCYNTLTITSAAKVTYNVGGNPYVSETDQYGGVLAK